MAPLMGLPEQLSPTPHTGRPVVPPDPPVPDPPVPEPPAPVGEQVPLEQPAEQVCDASQAVPEVLHFSTLVLELSQRVTPGEQVPAPAHFLGST